MKRIATYTYGFILMSLLISSKLISQVVINEIQMQPAGSSTGTNPQNLADCTPNGGAEFIELFNPNQCAAIDISCYIIGTNIAGTSAAAHGAFRFPAGTTIPPLGFVSIGGANSGATFVLNNYCGTANLAINPAGRWYLPNGDGYMMLYDASGAVVDAVYWTTGSSAADQAKWGTDSDINTNPTRIPAGTGACANISSLSGPANIPIASAEWMGQTAANGLSCARQTDGSLTWVNNASGTVNACNGACIVANTFHVPSSVTQPSCSSNNGVITINPSPVGSYTYSWTPNVSPTNVASNLGSGTYSITINSGGCQKDTSITLTAPNAPTAIVTNVTNATCGQANGSVTLGAVTGGTAPYQYNFNGLGLSSTTSYASLAAGSYSLIVSDNNGCTYTAPNVVISNGSAPTAIVTNVTNASCGQANGSVTLGAVTGGTAPYQYNFNGLGLSSTTSYTSLAAGNYSLIVSDNNGCTYTAPNVVVSNGSAPTAIVTNATNASCGQSNGSVTLGAVTGGTAPYQYNFNGAGLSSNVTYANLAAGSYPLNVQDANGCLYTAPSITILSPNAPTALASTTTNASCNSTDGIITIGTVTGGSAPYLYNLNNQGLVSTTTFSGLAAGTYTVLVQDINGCTYTAPAINISSANGPTAITINNIPATCGQANGSVNITNISGGTSPYQYNFNNVGLSTTTTYNNLNSGSYPIVVVDNNGCTYTTSTLITSDFPSFSLTTEISEPSCSNNDGNIEITSISGGTAPYQFDLNNSGFSTSLSYPDLSSGTYSVVVKDNTGCTNTFSLVIPKTIDELTLYSPNCFSPNEDEVNEFWKSFGTCISEYHCYIYNRWGENIVTLDSLEDKWDGNYKGKRAADGVYVYIIRAKDFNNSPISKSGHITLLR